MHSPLEFAQSVGDFVGNITHRQLADGLYSIGNGVGDCGIPIKYFQTLYEMPTDRYPSVWALVISTNHFRTLCEMPTDRFLLVWASVILTNHF